MKQIVHFHLNGESVEVEIEPHLTLLQLLRDKLELTGTKEGCGMGECGACTVLLDGKMVNSCIFPAMEVDGKSVITIEGLTDAQGSLHPIQKAFIELGAVQCGFCTPGMVLAAKSLLDENPKPTEEEIRHGIAGNLCRCTGYVQIIQAINIHDLKIPGMLHGKILYSAHPHARIKSIDTSQAEKLPGVKAVLTGYNIPPIKFGVYKDNVPLKAKKVCSLRDEIAAVAATDPDIAEEALRLIKVEYEILPALFDPEEAMKEGAVLIQEEHVGGKEKKPTNILNLPWRLIAGDVDEARKNSSYIAEDRFKVTWVTHCCLGTSGCVALFDLKNNLTVYSITQIPSLEQRDFTDALAALGLKGKKVRVIKTMIGGGFGSKLDTYAFEYIPILLAYKTRKPVKIVFSREEEFFATSPRQPAIIDIAQGCTKDGRLTFRDIRMTLDNGAYTSWGATTPSVMMMPISSLYQVPHVRYIAKCVYTNNTYSQAMRGYGNPQATFAIDSQIDILAELAGIDPLDFRLRNTNTPGEITPQNFKIITCGLRECIDVVAQRLDWRQVRGRKDGRGVGMASLIHVGGGARVYKSDGWGTIIKMDDFGTVNVFTGATDMGQGSDTVIAQIVAEELGVG